MRRPAQQRPSIGNRVAVGIEGARAVERNGRTDRDVPIEAGVGYRGDIFCVDTTTLARAELRSSSPLSACAVTEKI